MKNISWKQPFVAFEWRCIFAYKGLVLQVLMVLHSHQAKVAVLHKPGKQMLLCLLAWLCALQVWLCVCADKSDITDLSDHISVCGIGGWDLVLFVGVIALWIKPAVFPPFTSSFQRPRHYKASPALECLPLKRQLENHARGLPGAVGGALRASLRSRNVTEQEKQQSSLLVLFLCGPSKFPAKSRRQWINK